MRYATQIAKYKGLIFDMDGTLINSMPYHIMAWGQVAREHGFVITEDDVNAMAGASSYGITKHFKDLGNDVGDITAFTHRKVEIFLSHVNEIEIFHNVFSIVKEARQRGVKTAIGTGSISRNTSFVMNALKLNDYFDAVITSDCVTRHKPYPDTFLKAADAIGLKPCECLVFEDGGLGIKAAVNGGFDCIEVDSDRIVNYYEIDRG